MKTAFLYIRVSTDEQADTGYSQRHQDEMLRRYCEVNNISIKAAFFEDHSAKTFNRPEFTKLLLQLRKHRGIVDLVLFTKWDRFSRNAGDAYAMINTLNKLSVEPQAVEQPLNLEVPENKMMLAFYLAAPEVENDRRALNVFTGMRRAQKEGRWMASAPIGYKNINEGGRKFIAPDPARAEIVKWVFDEIASGKFTTEAIWKRAKEKGLNCSKNTFWNLIRNPAYCGKIRIKAFKNEDEQLVHGSHEPIISVALFHEAQDILDGKKKVQKTKISVDEKFPLRGFVTCMQCGKLLTASSSKGKKKYYSYYHCTSDCGIRFNSDQVNDRFVTELRRWKAHPAIQQLYKLVLNDVYKQGNKLKNEELRKTKDELSRLAIRQSKARDLLLSDSMEPDDYKAIKRECEQSIMKLESRLAELTSETTDIQPMMDRSLTLLSRLDEVYMNGDIIFKRQLVCSIFPEKLQFDGERYRTPRINEAVRLIYSLDKAFEEIKMGQIKEISDLSHLVIPLVHFSNLFLSDLRRLASLAA